MNPKVSIITPVYNSSDFIKETLDSVLNQTFQEWEMLLVDDCSTDNSSEIIKNFIEKDSRFILFSMPKNGGVALARNKAIENAKGKFIAFLDSDDLWDKNYLSKRIAKMETDNSALTFASYRLIDEKSNKTGEFHIPMLKADFHDLLKTNFMGCLTVIYNQEKLGKLYMENIKTRQDWILWLSILKTGIFAIGEDEVLASYRIRKNSLSSNKFKMIKNQWLVYRKYMQLSVFCSAYYLFNWMYFGFFKYKK